MRSGSGIYNVGGAHEVSLRDAIARFEEISGRRLDVREDAAVPGDQRRTNADTARIRSELGWEPRVSVDEGLQAEWDWACARVAAR
jgi:UDP-glucuronate 4-epimerase